MLVICIIYRQSPVIPENINKTLKLDDYMVLQKTYTGICTQKLKRYHSKFTGIFMLGLMVFVKNMCIN